MNMRVQALPLHSLCRRGRACLGLSKLAIPVSAQRGSAAPICGKPPAFRPILHLSFSSAQAGRLSLPACAERVLWERYRSERPSLSACQAAEPQVIPDYSEHNLDKPRACPTQSMNGITYRGGKPSAYRRDRGCPTLQLGSANNAQSRHTEAP